MKRPKSCAPLPEKRATDAKQVMLMTRRPNVSLGCEKSHLLLYLKAYSEFDLNFSPSAVFKLPQCARSRLPVRVYAARALFLDAAAALQN
jgi:hypothetical protein